MVKYCLILAYDGTNFKGWHKNGKLRTVQAELERALSTLLRRASPVEGASRTDAGVHALGQCASFESECSLDTKVLCLGLNALLPRDLRVRSATNTHPDFHPSLDAIEKTYTYTIACSSCHLPLQRWSSWHLFRPLSLSPMQRAAELLTGERDFRAFANQRNLNRQRTICKITGISLKQERSTEQLLITIRGSRFLYKMARNLVGTLIKVGLNKLSAEQIPSLFAAGERSATGITAPACGLVLHSIHYPPPKVPHAAQ